METPQRLGDAFVDDILAAAHPDFAAHDASEGDHRTADGHALREFKHLAHFRRADDDFLAQRIEQTRHACLHIINQLIDDRVKFDLHVGVLGFQGGGAVHTSMKSENDALRSGGQCHVVFGDCADIAVDDFEVHLVRLDLGERVHDGFNRALRVGFDNNLERLALLRMERGEKIFERDLGFGLQ